MIVVVDEQPTVPRILITEGETQTLVVSENVTTVVEVGIPGLQGPQGDPFTYLHTQTEPDDEWVIEHNLGGYPHPVIIDSADSLVEGEVSFPDQNTVVIRFAGAFSGRAFLS